jgi:MipA family protein
VGLEDRSHLHLDSPSLNGGWRLVGGPPGGYGGWQTLGAVSRRIGGHWVGVFVRHDHVGGAVFADSPLVERRSGWSVGLGWAMVLGRSSQTVTVYE